ncbi:MAG TPA: putative PEP-binding protein, partial [Chitinivibrionales bacterium]|nr:putative PEP-binding protein [Chitinivibrionales bacterium]
RSNEQVSSDYNPEHPILWKLLEDLVSASKETGKPLSICGEMAGRAGFAGKLLDIGITSLSVSPRLIPQVRIEMTEHRAAATHPDKRISRRREPGTQTHAAASGVLPPA